jgi:uncharacterized protein YqeY
MNQVKLIERIRAERIAAFKAKENIKKDVLGCLIADSCKEVKEPADSKVLAVIKKFIDGAEEMKAAMPDGSFEEFKAIREIEILSAYRPTQLTELEVRGIIAELEKMDLKGYMAHFKTTYEGTYDGKMVSTIAKEFV